MRLQVLGGYGDYLDTCQRANTPESQGLLAGGSGGFPRLAAAAGRVTGHNSIRSEAFVTLGSGSMGQPPMTITISPDRLARRSLSGCCVTGMPAPLARRAS